MAANIIVDIVLCLILLVGFIWGLISGFIKTVAKPVKFVLSIAIALSLASVVGMGVIKPLVSEPIVAQMTEFLTEKFGEIISTSSVDELPTLIKLAASLAEVNLDQLASAEGQEALVVTFVEAITDPVLNIISSVIAFIILYILAKIVIGIVFAIINSIVDNGIVGVVNRILGCILMTCLAAALVWCLCAISELILGLPFMADQAWVREFTGGAVYTFFKNLSPVDLLLNLLLSF